MSRLVLAFLLAVLSSACTKNEGGTTTGTPLLELNFSAYSSSPSFGSLALCVSELHLRPAGLTGFSVVYSLTPTEVTVSKTGIRFKDLTIATGTFSEAKLKLSASCASGQSAQVSNLNGNYAITDELELRFAGLLTVSSASRKLVFDVQDLVLALEPVASAAALAGLIQQFHGSVDLVNPNLILDDFESGAIRQVQPSQTVPRFRDLWNFGNQDNTLGIFNGACYLSSYCLRQIANSGPAILAFYPNNGLIWQWMREYLQQPAMWKTDSYNRMRFWLKTPADFAQAAAGGYNVSITVYLRGTAESTLTRDGGDRRYVYMYNVPGTGGWHQIGLDTHPSWIAGGSTETEYGDRPYPTGESGHAFFDAITSFQVEAQAGAIQSYPATFYFDHFEVYRESRVENVEQVYGLHGSFDSGTNTLSLGWLRSKPERTITHEVRYAFSDIHALGWDNATPAPGGSVSPNPDP
ncbi:MAG TPA: hypothetical protein VFV50_02855, partial [Bdellovibrionales bacterium]|nr:hypothetical protein [Bdellovibrionales bacterium]